MDTNDAPIFLSKPCFVIGSLVFFATFCLNAVIPINRFNEKLNPLIV